MGRLSIDLIEQAEKLIQIEQRRPKQASLRRAISNAYYAVFHLIVEDGINLIVGKSKEDAAMVNYFQRSFEHSAMKSACEDIRKSNLPHRHGPISGPFPVEIKQIAIVFLELQKARHEADYNQYLKFSKTDAQDAIGNAKDVVANWNYICSVDKKFTKQFVTILLLQKSKRG